MTGLAGEDEEDLRACLTYSLAAHILAAASVFLLVRGAAVKATSVYMIDFVGPSAAIISSAPPPEAGQSRGPAAYKPQPQTEIDEFSTKKRPKGAPLPRPSLLRGWQETPASEDKPAPAAEAPQPAAAAPAAGPPGDAGIMTDMPNFPYPWYISQLRQSLWVQWSARMPSERGECIVVFTLRPNGSVVDLRTEESSGDAAFDLTALGAVRDAGPFPPLPKGFTEKFLKIHVTLKKL